MQVTVLAGSTFCISDDRGDICVGLEGLFAEDTRHLSRLALRLAGKPLLPLTSRLLESFEASFVLRNPVVAGLGHDEVAILRRRTVAGGLEERIELRNLSRRELSFPLDLELASDFADIFTVKENDPELDRPERPRPLPQAAPAAVEERGRALRFSDREPSEAELRAETQVVLSQTGEMGETGIRYDVRLAPGAGWTLVLQVVPSSGFRIGAPEEAAPAIAAERARVSGSLARWRAGLPTLETGWTQLERSYRQAVIDIAALRMPFGASGELIAAGLPWFMTVFGRDTLIASLQTLPLGSELSRAGLRCLAALQAVDDDPSIDAEPGKIVHELRRGKAAERWFGRYYGTVDATPLFLVLLSEHWRWTGDDALVDELRGNAIGALDWIEGADRDGDGFVEFERRNDRGIENQTWKDSHDSQLFHDGTMARGAIAAAEVQGYVYDAKLRTAELARAVWGDPALAERLEREAATLRERFDTAFWCERGTDETYALALDGEKRQVDSLTSNIGHLLWSGIVPEARIPILADQLLGPELWSGWGVRTMASGDAGYNPLAYHDGTVWPHDNSLIAWGLARSGRREEMLEILRAQLEASSYFDYQLPEVFAGFSRADIGHPVVYPTASRPQAWAAGTVILLLRLLLELEPDPAGGALVTHASAGLPDWAGRVELAGIPALGATWTATADGDGVRVERDS